MRLWTFFALGLATALPAQTTLIDGTTLGYHNARIGMALNGSSPLFPPIGGDPSIDNCPEPDLSLVAAILGNWLTDPANLNANWWGPLVIPQNWPVNTEEAIIYAIDVPVHVDRLEVEIGVDNSAFVWFDGVYQVGQVRSGIAVLGELTTTLHKVSAGRHYLQLLRADNGGVTDYLIRVRAFVDGSFVPYGGGCANSLGIPVFRAVEKNVPTMNATFAAETIGVPATAMAVQLLGLSDRTWNGTPLPLSLGFVRRADCSLLTSVEAALWLRAQPNCTACLALPIPNSSSLIGGTFYAQTLILEGMTVSTSNGAALTIGN